MPWPVFPIFKAFVSVLKRVYISVINDLVTDQRVHRVAKLLSEEGVDVTCIGRQLKESPLPQNVPFRVKRFKMIFNKGPLFYACFNLRLWLKLMFSGKTDLIISNDLDTLPACLLSSRFRRVPLIYDSHEFFTQMPELIHRKAVQRIWKWIEGFCLPRLRYALTVSYSIATIYRRLYGIPFRVVRNMPERIDSSTLQNAREKKQEKQMIIYQGALNVGRGLENLIDAMLYLEEAQLLIAGEGDIEHDLHLRVKEKGLGKRVRFVGRLQPADLLNLTAQADLGISLEEDLGLNYRYALPNKLFDYIQCRVPVLSSSLPEMARIVESYGVGVCTPEKDPEKLAGVIRYMLKERLGGSWMEALEKAAEELCWEKEALVYREMLQECGVILQDQ
jgi:glycosyltransferase involved in cell wall biosynthesis